MAEEEFALDISLTRVEKPVRIGGVKYVVKEMTGTQRDKWLNDMGSRMKTDVAGKPTGLRTFDNVQAGLIALCLYDEQGKSVDVKVIQEWPAKAQSALFTLCQELNGLGDDKNVEKAKND